MSIKLDKRLQAIASYVNSDDIVADIGTDHGYLPCYLTSNHLVSKAYATDISSTCLQKAIDLIAKNSLQNKVFTFHTPGLKDLPIDTNCIIIAGMGGHLISKIIEDSNILYDKLILAPNTHAEVVRTSLNGKYIIESEEIIQVNEKFYSIIKAKLGHSNYSLLELKYGPINLINLSPEFINKYTIKLESLKKHLLTANNDLKLHDELVELEQILKTT